MHGILAKQLKRNMLHSSNMFLLGCLFAFSQGCESTEPNSLEQLKSDQSNLQGKWVLKTVIDDGREGNSLIGTVYEFKKDRMTMTTPDGQIIRFQFFLAPSETGPNRFDSVQRGGLVLVAPRPKTIYQLEGGILRLCTSEEEYPEELSAPEGSKRVLATLHRVKTTD